MTKKLKYNILGDTETTGNDVPYQHHITTQYQAYGIQFSLYEPLN